MSATCEPPPEHRGETWHWLRSPYGSRLPVKWADNRWWTFLATHKPEQMARDGWRYVGPAIPPQEGE